MLEEVASDLASINRSQLVSKITHGLLLVVQAKLRPASAEDSTQHAHKVSRGGAASAPELMLTRWSLSFQLYNEVLREIIKTAKQINKDIAHIESEQLAMNDAAHLAPPRTANPAELQDQAQPSGTVDDGPALAPETAEAMRARYDRRSRLQVLKMRARGQCSP